MRLLSQDGRIDLTYEMISIELVSGTTIVAQTYLLGNKDGNFATMAKYSAESKARKAMEMLHDEWNNFGESGLFQFPLDSEMKIID